MEKEDRNAAIWLFLICLVCSWTWLVDHLYEVGLYPALFVCLLSGLAYYGMWRIIRYVGVNTGWKKIGILTAPEQDDYGSEPSKLPIIMQISFDVSFLLIFPIQSWLSNSFEIPGYVMTLVLTTFIIIKWHNFYLSEKSIRN